MAANITSMSTLSETASPATLENVWSLRYSYVLNSETVSVTRKPRAA